MSKPPSYVIIGNGITGITAAELLRQEDASCAITIIADDPFPAYYRPALKDYLGGHLSEEKLWARPETFYQDQRINFIPARVVQINTTNHTVHLHNGQQIAYSRLLLANGARPRTLNCPGLDLAGVSTLRTVVDYQQLLRALPTTNRIVISGSGTLALESAEILHQRGYQVTHLVRGNGLWSEVLDRVASDMILQEERRAGIDVRIEEEIAQIVGRNGRVSHIITRHGEQIPCEMVLIAVGVDPIIDFIQASGIACGRGVQVGNGMQTNVPDVYAAGDVIETKDIFTGQTRVIGQWFPAIQQAQVAAYNMLNILPPNHPFAARPNAKENTSYLNYYNATLLYGLDFASIGLTTCPTAPGYQEIVAEPAPRNYRKIILLNGVIVGALLLGDRKLGLSLKQAIDHRVNMSAIAQQIFTDDFDLDAWLVAQGVPDPRLDISKGGDEQRTGARQALTVEVSALPDNDETRAAIQSGDIEAYFVPVPHPQIQLTVPTTQLGAGGKAQTVTIGRQPGVSLLLDHRSVSRVHAEIICGWGEYRISDKGSANGTVVNGTRLKQGEQYRLCHHDQVRFGDIRFRFELRPRRANTNETGLAPAVHASFSHIQGSELHTSVSRLIPDSVIQTLTDAPTLVIVVPNIAPIVTPLAANRRYALGRDNENDIVLPDPSSSRQHAELFTASDSFYLRDFNSRYGVFVNKVKINNAYQLSHGDRIVIGNTLLYFSHLAISRVAAGKIGKPVTEGQKDATVITRTSSPQTKNLPVVQEKPLVGLQHRRQVLPLNQGHVKFEINMCIGCNRCMDACPLPMSSQVAIAELNYATITDQASNTITRFTHECIMCGSCVPVCPVDNHRDLLMLALKQRLGISWDDQPDAQRLAAALPVGWSPQMLVARLREQGALNNVQNVPDNYLLHIIAASNSRVINPGETIIREGSLWARPLLDPGWPGRDQRPRYKKCRATRCYPQAWQVCG